MAVRKILTIGDETLRKKSRTVTQVDARIRTLLADMADTLHASGDGVGLAAPQVGVLRRVVVIDVGDGVRNYINPEIVASEGTRVVTESCLSIPGVSSELERPEKVTVKAMDETGKEFTETADGLLGDCLCHEIDHLDGVLFIDRAREYRARRKPVS